MTPNLIKKIADQIILHEGLRLKPYHCPLGNKDSESLKT